MNASSAHLTHTHREVPSDWTIAGPELHALLLTSSKAILPVMMANVRAYFPGFHRSSVIRLTQSFLGTTRTCLVKPATLGSFKNLLALDLRIASARLAQMVHTMTRMILQMSVMNAQLEATRQRYSTTQPGLHCQLDLTTNVFQYPAKNARNHTVGSQQVSH